MDALPLLATRREDYPGFMAAVEMAIDMNWGLRSRESAAVRRAFARIGMGTGETCAFVNIKPWYCESDPGIQLCIDYGFSDDNYYWSSYPLSWTVTEINSNCIRITNWPQYDYYPQNFNITLRNLTKNTSKTYKIRLEDCEGDDPGCNDVGTNALPPSHTSAQERSEESETSEPFTLLRIFDINGRKVYEGKDPDENFTLNNMDGLLIYCYYDRQGKIIKTKKTVIVK